MRTRNGSLDSVMIYWFAFHHIHGLFFVRLQLSVTLRALMDSPADRILLPNLTYVQPAARGSFGGLSNSLRVVVSVTGRQAGLRMKPTISGHRTTRVATAL